VPPMHGCSCCWGMNWVFRVIVVSSRATHAWLRLSLGAWTGRYGIVVYCIVPPLHGGGCRWGQGLCVTGDAQGEGGCMHPPCSLLFCGARRARRGTRRARVSVYSPRRTFSPALTEKHGEMWDRSNPPHQLPSVHRQWRAPCTPLSGRLRFGLSPLFSPWLPHRRHRQEHTPFKLILSLRVH
jgi:hypothetical protein